MRPILSNFIGPDLARAMGLDPKMVQDITIFIKPDSIVYAEVTCLLSKETIEMTTKRFDFVEREAADGPNA